MVIYRMNGAVEQCHELLCIEVTGTDGISTRKGFVMYDKSS